MKNGNGAVFIAVISLLTFGASPLQANDVEKGEQLFRQSCRACHGVSPGIMRSGGPNLSGLTKDGRLGVDPSYKYSPAFEAQAAEGATWSKEALDAFLKSPSQMIEGTTMPIGAPTANERGDILAYLFSLNGKD